MIRRYRVRWAHFFFGLVAFGVLAGLAIGGGEQSGGTARAADIARTATPGGDGMVGVGIYGLDDHISLDQQKSNFRITDNSFVEGDTESITIRWSGGGTIYLGMRVRENAGGKLIPDDNQIIGFGNARCGTPFYNPYIGRHRDVLTVGSSPKTFNVTGCNAGNVYLTVHDFSGSGNLAPVLATFNITVVGPTATPTSTYTPTATYTRIPTATATVTQTPLPTATPTHTKTPTWGPVFHNDSHSGSSHGHSHMKNSKGKFEYWEREPWTSTPGPWQRPRGWNAASPTSTPMRGVWWHERELDIPSQHYHVHAGRYGIRSAPRLSSSFPDGNIGRMAAGRIQHYRIIGGNNPITVNLTRNEGYGLSARVVPVSTLGDNLESLGDGRYIRDLRMNIPGRFWGYRSERGRRFDNWDQYGYRLNTSGIAGWLALTFDRRTTTNLQRVTGYIEDADGSKDHFSFRYSLYIAPTKTPTPTLTPTHTPTAIATPTATYTPSAPRLDITIMPVNPNARQPVQASVGAGADGVAKRHHGARGAMQGCQTGQGNRNSVNPSGVPSVIQAAITDVAKCDTDLVRADAGWLAIRAQFVWGRTNDKSWTEWLWVRFLQPEAVFDVGGLDFEGVVDDGEGFILEMDVGELIYARLGGNPDKDMCAEAGALKTGWRAQIAALEMERDGSGTTEERKVAIAEEIDALDDRIALCAYWKLDPVAIGWNMYRNGRLVYLVKNDCHERHLVRQIRMFFGWKQDSPEGMENGGRGLYSRNIIVLAPDGSLWRYQRPPGVYDELPKGFVYQRGNSDYEGNLCIYRIPMHPSANAFQLWMGYWGRGRGLEPGSDRFVGGVRQSYPGGLWRSDGSAYLEAPDEFSVWRPRRECDDGDMIGDWPSGNGNQCRIVDGVMTGTTIGFRITP